MSNRILSIALALSLVVVAFAAFPMKTTAYVDYTGSVRTTNDVNETKTTFVQGEHVYFTVELYYLGDPANASVFLSVTGGSSMAVTTVAGWYVSPDHSTSLIVYTFSTPDVKVCDVVATVGGYEFARTQITVLSERLTLDPDLDTYYPGQSVAISLVTIHTEDFYVEIVNETGEDLENWTSQESGEDRYWNTVWNIPADFPDGDYTINVVNENVHDNIWLHDHFAVSKYDLYVWVDRDCVLPKETVSIHYMIFNVATGLPYDAPMIVIEYQYQYFNASVERVYDDNETNVSGTLPPGGSGTFDYTIPSDIALWSDVWFTFWANESDRSSAEELRLRLSLLDAAVSTDDSTYYPSEPVGVTVTAYAEALGYFDPLEGAAVSVKVFLNGTEIAIYGATGLVTGKNGQVTYTFTLLQNAPAGVYIVEATVMKLDMTKVVMRAFSVAESAKMTVDFDNEVYIGGDVATVSFRPILNNMDYVGANISYIVYIEGGILASGSSSGEDVSVVIPVDYYGELAVEAVTYINGNPVGDDDDAYVVIAELLLVVAEHEYRPGETIVWNWEIRTGMMNASLTYWVNDGDNVLMDTGAPAFASTGSIEFTVPEEGVSYEYTATLRMTSALGGVTETSVTAYVYDEYELLIWVKKSKYASGEFKPGDTMTIGYEILSHLDSDLPTYRLLFTFSNDDVYYWVLVTETEGTFEYEIPEDGSSGQRTVNCYLLDGGGTTDLDHDYAYYDVNSRLSFWDLSAGGMAASDFLLMVLLVVLIIALIVMPMAKGWKAKSKSDSGPTTEEPTPPAEPPPKA